MKKILFVAGFATITLVACNKSENASARIQEGNTTTNSETAAMPTATNSDVATSATAQDGFPKIAFDKTVHDFGDLKKGSKGEVEFEIKNEGTVDLVVIDAKASCGCTVPEKPQSQLNRDLLQK